FVAFLAQLEIGADELAQLLRLRGFLLGFPGLSNDILAEPGLSKHHGRFLANGRQRARHPRPKGLPALLRANAVLDEQRRLAACEFSNAEPGQFVVKLLYLELAHRNLQSTDFLVSEFGHDGLPLRTKK